jgi:hypothetical protein
MTPRQIIQQISERRRLHNITTRDNYLEGKKCQNAGGNTSRLVNKTNHETNKEIKQSKLEEFWAQRVGEPRIPCEWVETSMYNTLGNYLQGNAIATKSRESPTRFYDSSQVEDRKTSDCSITSSLYTRFNNVREDNQRVKSQKMNTDSRARRMKRVDSWPENAYLHSGMSNIRGMAKKIHHKSIAMENIITANEKHKLIKTESGRVNERVVDKTKEDFNEQRQKLTNKDTESRGEHDSIKRIRVHIYVPTAEMNS